MSNEVEETMKRIQSHKGVVGTIVVNSEGIPVKSTLDNTTTVQYAGLISSLADKARSVVRDLDPSNDLTFLRIRSKKHEIMVAPDKEFILIVVQNPSDWSSGSDWYVTIKLTNFYCYLTHLVCSNFND